MKSIKSLRKKYSRKAMITEANLPEGTKVEVFSYRHPGDKTSRVHIGLVQNDDVVGNIELMKVESQGFWKVNYVQAPHGYGPLLYDIAMEYATTNGSGLTADTRGHVSRDALRVWDKCGNDRLDVEKLPLPLEYRYYHHNESHPTNFVYTKKPEMTTNLESSGRLIYSDFEDQIKPVIQENSNV